MKKTFIAISTLMLTLGCTKAGAFQGFGHFENMLQTIECVRKPGTDYLVCGPKT